MAFNIYGISSSGQWKSLKAFTQIQKFDILLRKQMLQKDLLRIGVFVTEYDGIYPKSFKASANGYAAKLIMAYKIMGGDPEKEFLLRTRDQPVFLNKENPVSTDTNGLVTGGSSDVYSNGRRNRGGQRFDRDLGIMTDDLKSFELEAIKMKRERLEFKIKRALDYSDQIQQEINQLDQLLGDTQKNLDGLVLNIEFERVAPGTSTTVDNDKDLWGLDIGKPVDFAIDDAAQKIDTEAQRGS